MTFLDKADGPELQNAQEGERRVVNLAVFCDRQHFAPAIPPVKSFAWLPAPGAVVGFPFSVGL